jgi:hypothetical protein
LLIFLVVIFGIAMIACDTGENEVPEKYEGPVWTTVENSPIGKFISIQAIAYGQGIFVAGGEYGNMAWSNDGKTWTGISVEDSTFGQSQSINAIAYGNGIFVAGGSVTGSGNLTGKMAWSADGKKWTSVPVEDNPLSFNKVYAIAYGQGIFVAGGNSGQLVWSNDNGKTWTAVESEKNPFGSDNIRAITFGASDSAGRFIAVANSGKMAFSQSDVLNWTEIKDTPFSSSISEIGITYGGGKFVTVSNISNGIAYSDFGESKWTKVKSSTSLSVVTYGDGMFVAAGSYGIVFSSDGITWTSVPDEYDGSISAYSIAYGIGKFVIGGVGKLAYSN